MASSFDQNYDILPTGISSTEPVISSSNNKHDPQWSANAARGIISSHGAQLIEVKNLLKELSEIQKQMLERLLPEAERTILRSQQPQIANEDREELRGHKGVFDEFISQVEKIPEYQKKADARASLLRRESRDLERGERRRCRIGRMNE